MPRQTTLAKPGEIKTVWRHIDAEGKTLGRLATEVATVLMGKHRPEFTPHVQTGDSVIVTNAAKVVLTGNKLDSKTRRRWSGYPGGVRVQTYREVLATNPERLVTEAIVRMLPSGILGRRMATQLRVFKGTEHTHAAQNPVAMSDVTPRRRPAGEASPAAKKTETKSKK